MDEKLGKVERIRQRAHELWEREGRPMAKPTVTGWRRSAR